MESIVPWKSQRKAEEYMSRKRYTETQKKERRQARIPDSWSWKKARKLMLPTFGPRYSFAIDLFFPGKFMYLLAINLNTRKAYAIKPSPIRKMPRGGWYVPRTNLKTGFQCAAMLSLLCRQTPVHYLLSDQEKGFMGVRFQGYCRANNIQHEVYVKNKFGGLIDTNADSRGNHSMLGLIDRLTRTIRQLAYNLGVKNQDIDPDTMNYILDEYNNSPHTTFWNVLHRAITPKEMDNNPELEDEFVNILAKRKFLIKNQSEYDLEGKRVRVYNEAHVFDKVRPKLLPGLFDVAGRDGYLYVVKKGNNVLKLPRYLLKAI